MSKIDINALIRDVIAQSETLAETLLKDFKDKAISDVRQFLTDSQADLERWTGELAAGEITKDEFHDLVQGQIDVALLHGLKQSGLTQIEIDKFTNGVIDIVTSVAFSAAKSLIP
jgi:hypothetical protein